jgi:hypothetical protein
MKPGRLPEDHPDERKARDQLRNLSPAALAKLRQQREPQPTPKPAPQPTTRWT